MKTTELLRKLEGVCRAIEEAKAGRRRLSRRIRTMEAERLAVLGLLGDGVETPTRKSPRRESEGRERQGDSVSVRSIALAMEEVNAIVDALAEKWTAWRRENGGVR